MWRENLRNFPRIVEEKEEDEKDERKEMDILREEGGPTLENSWKRVTQCSEISGEKREENFLDLR